jgi:hypothetical protein
VRSRVVVAMLAGAVLAGCGSTTTPSPSASSTPSASGAPSPTALGLNVHSDPATTASVVGNAQQGTQLAVLDYRPENGGWLKVQGQTRTGWIVSDPSLTAPGMFIPYSAQGGAFTVLIPNAWTFNEAPAGVVFRPQQGIQTIVVRSAATLAALGDERPGGYISQSVTQEIVCGYTGNVVLYSQAGSAATTASPNPSAVTPLANYAVIRLVFNAMHAMEIAMNYQTADQLNTFKHFYNSISFPYQQCMAQASPSPT